MGLQTALLFPLHLGVLLILHSIFALVRLVHVVSQLFPQISRHQSTSSSPSVDLARKRWTKVPKHLAVVLAPVQWRAGSQGDVEAKKEQLIKLMEWCKELGIPQLSVYDRDGMLTVQPTRLGAVLLTLRFSLSRNSRFKRREPRYPQSYATYASQELTRRIFSHHSRAFNVCDSAETGSNRQSTRPRSARDCFFR